MLYDRPYMRRNLSPRLNCLTDFLILTLIVSFIFQSVLKLFAVDLPLLRSFGLSFESLKSGFIWTLFTYSFLHEGALHLLFNILGIHFISRNLEYSLTRESFIMLFLFSIFLGSISWLSFNINGGFLIGTSAFVMGSLTRFCLMRPDNPITFLLFFVLPISLKPKHLLFGVMGLELYGFIFSELQNISNIAHSAHLGGMLAGFILSTSLGKSLILPRFSFKSSKVKSAKSKTTVTDYSIDSEVTTDLENQVDKILDKINEKGFGSLTDREKSLLEKAKSLFKTKT